MQSPIFTVTLEEVSKIEYSTMLTPCLPHKTGGVTS